jgi:RHS repeat-associated protein
LVLLAVTMVASAALGIESAPVSAAAPLDWLARLSPSTRVDSAPVAPPVRHAESAPVATNTPAPPVTVSLPRPGIEEIVPKAGQRVDAAGGVVSVRSEASSRLRVEVLDQAVSARAGVSGFAFRVSEVDRAGQAAGAPVELSIDYSRFAHAFGAGYADRLRVITLPACAVADPVPVDCRSGGTVLAARNDAGASRLVVSAAASDTAVLAVTSDVSGESGNFAASPLAASDSWQVAPGSGEFSWSYPIKVPNPPSGAAPTVGLSYSSGAVDGLVSTRNTQGPQSGVGWSDFASAFVERRYTSCVDTVGTGDLCWKSHNATISLNGQASEMVALDAARTTWYLKDDPGWRVEHLHGTFANGDENREYWKVTTPDGTRYFFGLGVNPDTGTATDSVWTVPVLADHDNEPCRPGGGGVGSCDQAWRWNLDRVVDPNGIVTTYSYVKEINHYLAVGGLGNHQQPYVRGGRLATIEYGKPQGTGPEVAPAGRVIFEAEHRCRDLNHTCPAPTRTNGSLFPDVPNDLVCATDCLATSPTFFSGKRYSAVRTEVRVGGQWRAVEQINLYHAHLTNRDGDVKLYLGSIQRVGLSQGGFLVLPSIVLFPVELPNRVDVNLAAGKKPMGHFRVGVILDEYGGETWVTYGQQNPCAASYAGPWDQNAKDCFPAKLGTRTGVFHKYLTTRVEERDKTGGSPTVATSYAYEGLPAWHHDDDEFVRLADQSWSSWRGYATTTITTGAERTKVRIFRGMNGDRLSSGGPRQAAVEPFDGAGFDTVPAVSDEPWLAGAVLVAARLGPIGEVAEATLHEYETRVQARPGNDPQDWAVWVGETRKTASISRAVNVFEQQRTTTGYNAFLQVETEYQEGWLSQTGDERCTRTSYAVNQPAWLVTSVSGVVTVAGGCGSSTVLSQSETYYDGSTTLGAPPVKGNATRQRVRLTASTWVTTADTSYDAFGRVVRVADAAGLVTETAHEGTPNGGFPRTTTETQRVGSASHVTVTDWLPEHGVALRQADANGKATTTQYDGLGRVTKVWQPTEPTTGPPSWEFAYQISPNKSAPPVVRSRRAQSADLTTFTDTWTVYDSFLHQRQTHTLSPQANQVVVTTTTYNDRGRVEDQISPQAVPGQPGAGLLAGNWENRTRTLYDGLGRVSRVGWYRGGTEQWAEVSTYTHDTTTIERPDNRRSRGVVDGLGRSVRAEEFDGSAWQATVTGYDLADRTTSVTDPAGNTMRYTYNLAGWRLTEDDPDAGLWSFGYDNAGRQTTVTDARGAVTHTAYDQLGRPVETRRDGATGPLLARWEYDAPGEKGMVNRAIRATAQGEWVVDTTGYDGRGRPLGTKWTVPSGLPGLAGEYTLGYGYDRADHITSVSYPAIGGLPSETVTTVYNSLGLPERMTGIDEYVWSASYDSRGRPATLGAGPRPNGQPWLGKSWSYDIDQRLARMQTSAGSTVSDHQFGYDRVGVLTQRTNQLGAETWRECFGYDVKDRLTSAYSTSASTCDGSQRGTGSRPYNHAYTYGSDGNLRTRVEGGTTFTYAYPTGAGVDRPHAPTAVNSDAYTWDANGNLASRRVAGRAETLTWDAERLASVAGPDGASDFVYDPSGARLLRTTPNTRTAYLAGHEINANLAGSSVIAVRSYGFAGQPIAVRTPAGVDYLVTDQQGSVEASLPSGGNVDVARAYSPYGTRRGGGELDTDQGWIGQIEDDSTKLSYLNARYYDPNLGRFLSPDPLYDRSDPESLNPYGYGYNSPTNATDASGLAGCWGWECQFRREDRPGNCWGWECNHVRARRHLVAISSFPNTSPHRRWALATNNQRYLNAVGYNGHPMANRATLRALHNRAVLTSMRRANPDPGFWRALARAGSGQGLVLGGLRAANPDPGFWRALHAAGSGKALVAAGRRLAKANHANAIAREHQVGPRLHGYSAAGGRSVRLVGDDDEEEVREFIDEINSDPWADEVGQTRRHDGCWIGTYDDGGCVGGGVVKSEPVKGAVAGGAGGCIGGWIATTFFGGALGCVAVGTSGAAAGFVSGLVRSIWPG